MHSYHSNFIIKMILLSTILTISKRRLEKNSFEILPGSGIEIRGCPLAPTYRHILYWLSGKLTSKRAVEIMPSLPPGKCFPKPYVNSCRFLIHFVVFSFHQFEWMSIQNMTNWKYFELYKNSECQFTHKKIEPVFVKHYAPNICLLLNMAKFTQCLIATKKKKKKKNGFCRKV